MVWAEDIIKDYYSTVAIGSALNNNKQTIRVAWAGK
jgi:hypothetical protein